MEINAPAQTAEPEKPANVTDEEWEAFKVDYPTVYESMRPTQSTLEPMTK
jgi:hypothetical protein